jgi:hypothetical protein
MLGKPVVIINAEGVIGDVLAENFWSKVPPVLYMRPHVVSGLKRLL